MRRTVKLRLFSAAAVASILGAVAFAGPAQAYVAGSASVSAITYNATTGQMNWSCSFTGWAQPVKYYTCEQWGPDRTYIVHSYGGQWSGTTLHTRVYSQPDNVNWYAYRANAGYNDGSSSASFWRWG
jgi:hypothetical protein